MGLYSNTRVDSLNEYASEEFKRTVNVESLIEACIEIRENDYKMFESLLNLDFAEASMLNESKKWKGLKPTQRAKAEKEEDAGTGTDERFYDSMADAKDAQGAPEDNEVGPAEAIKEANKSKIKIIWDKIVKFFETVIQKIKAFFGKITQKITEIISRDKAIVAKYKDAFTPDKLEGFPGLSDFSKPTKTPEEMQAWAATEVTAMEKQFNSAIAGVKSATNKAAVDAKVEQFTGEEIPNVLSKEGTTNTLFEKFERDKKFVPGDTWMNMALKSISDRSGILDAIKKNNAEFEKRLNESKATLKKEYDEAAKNKGTSDLNLAIAAGAFKLAQGYSRKVIKVADNFVKVISKAFAAYRRAVLIVGKYCLSDKKAEKTEKVNASFEFDVMDFAIAEASDLYVAESLGY